MEADPSGFLGQMASESRERVARARSVVPEDAMRERALARGSVPTLEVPSTGFDIIAEVKLRSPSEGNFGGDLADTEERVAGQVRTYSGGGAAAISVLTEPREFSGHLDHVFWASDATATPVMRKDFLVDPYQILEARAAGASGVLLIARILEDDQVLALAEEARSLGMFSLIECFDEQDIDRTAALWHFLSGEDMGSTEAAPTLLGVNSRDLTTLQVKFDRLLSLAPRLPESALTVAESGIGAPHHARAVANAGYRMALVGSALMKASDPGGLLSSLVAAGREEAGCASA